MTTVQVLLENNGTDDIFDNQDSNINPNFVIHSNQNTDTVNDSGDEQCFPNPFTGGQKMSNIENAC